MGLSKEVLSGFIESGGVFSPLLFIFFHLLRPILFIPVVLFCIAGGLLFGVVAGFIYSLIGITLSSIFFYILVRRTPKIFHRIISLKNTVFGERIITTKAQITLLRLVPFIHFNLLSICLIELTVNGKDYVKSSFYTSIPFTLVYTSVGQWLMNVTPIYSFFFFACLLPLLYIFRKKEITIKWNDFFHANA